MVAVRIISPEDITPVGVAADPGQRRAQGEDFGAGIGSELAQFGNVLTSLSNNLLQKRQATEDAIAVTRFKIERNQELYKDFDDAKKTAPVGANKFHQELWDKWERESPRKAAEFKKRYPMSKDAEKRLELLDLELRANYGSDAVSFENNERVRQLTADTVKNIDDLAGSAAAHGGFADVQKQIDEVLTAAKPLYTPEQEEAVRDSARKKLADSVKLYADGLYGSGVASRDDLMTKWQAVAAEIDDLEILSDGDKRFVKQEIGTEWSKKYAAQFPGEVLKLGMEQRGEGSPSASEDEAAVKESERGSLSVGLPQTLDALWPRLIRQESGGNQSAVSSKGATGVAQVMPGTGPEAARLAGLPWDANRLRTDRDYNEALGKAYLAEQWRVFGGNPAKALAAYNAGPGRTHNAIEKYGDDWLAHMPAETRDYVASILGGKASGGTRIASADQSYIPSPKGGPFDYMDFDTWQSVLKRSDAVNTQMINDDIASIRSTGVPVIEDANDMAASLSPDRASEWLQKRELAQDYYGAVSDLKSLPNDQINQRIEQEKPQPGSENYADQQANYADIATAGNAIVAARKKDPAGYVISENPDVRKAWESFDPKNPATAKAAIGATIAAQQALGIPPSDIVPLPGEQADMIAKAINDPEQPADARIQTLIGMIAQTPDEDQQRAIFRQLVKAGVPDKAEVVIDAYMRGDTGAARRMFEAAMVKPDNLPGKNVRDPGFDDALSESMFGDGTTGQAFYALDYRDPRTTAVAQRDFELAKSAATLSMLTGKNQTDAIDQAIKDIQGSVIRVEDEFSNGGGVLGIVPETTNVESLKAGMEAVMPQVMAAAEALKAQSLASIPADASPEVRRLFDAAHGFESANLITEGVFRPYGDGWGFYDPYSNAFLPSPDGKALVWTTEELIRASVGGVSGGSGY